MHIELTGPLLCIPDSARGSNRRERKTIRLVRMVAAHSESPKSLSGKTRLLFP